MKSTYCSMLSCIWNHTLKAWCNKDVTSLLTQWNYVFLTLSYQHTQRQMYVVSGTLSPRCLQRHHMYSIICYSLTLKVGTLWWGMINQFSFRLVIDVIWNQILNHIILKYHEVIYINLFLKCQTFKPSRIVLIYFTCSINVKLYQWFRWYIENKSLKICLKDGINLYMTYDICTYEICFTYFLIS